MKGLKGSKMRRVIREFVFEDPVTGTIAQEMFPVLCIKTNGTLIYVLRV